MKFFYYYLYVFFPVSKLQKAFKRVFWLKNAYLTGSTYHRNAYLKV